MHIHTKNNTSEVDGSLQKFMQFCELRNKEVVNIRDGMRLGYIEDLTLNSQDGCICSIIIPASDKILGVWGRERRYIIDWCQIVRIGSDIVLVDIDCEQCVCEKEMRKER